MVPDLSTMLLFLTTAFLLTIAPGPDIIYVAMRGLAQGKKAGVAAALGLVTGIFVHIILAAFGLSAILASSPLLFTIIKFMGAAYIIYIGYQIACSGPIVVEGDQDQPSLSQIFRQTVLMNILNPKVALFFLAFLPQFVNTSSEHATVQFLIFGVLFQLNALFVMGSIGLFSGAIAARLSNSVFYKTKFTKIAGSAVMAIGAFIPAQEIWNWLSEV